MTGLGSEADGCERGSRRSGQIGPFIVMDVIRAAAEREAQGQRVIHMEVGQPGTPAPRVVRQAVARAIDRETLGYTQALGIPALRARIAQHYREVHQIDVPASRVIVTAGSSAGFVLAFLALFDAGDRVAMPSPGYPCYRQIMRAYGIEPVILETGPAGRWMPTPDDIAAAARHGSLKGVLVASPANPTGSMLDRDRLAALIAAARQAGAWFVSDEIYHGLAYEMAETTALSVSADAIVINSFSKYFSMTGWRIGWMVVPEDLVRPIERLQQNLFICAPAVSQAAALAAFDARQELDANRAVYLANREVLLKGLPQVGLGEIVPADGAFYAYVDVGRYTDDSLAFARAMLEETGIAATPGVDFDETRGGRFLRFSYAGTTVDMEEALDRLARWRRLRG